MNEFSILGSDEGDVSPSLEKPPRERYEVALAIAQEALRHIVRTATRADIKESADHALNKIGILMTEKPHA